MTPTGPARPLVPRVLAIITLGGRKARFSLARRLIAFLERGHLVRMEPQATAVPNSGNAGRSRFGSLRVSLIELFSE